MAQVSGQHKHPGVSSVFLVLHRKERIQTMHCLLRALAQVVPLLIPIGASYLPNARALHYAAHEVGLATALSQSIHSSLSSRGTAEDNREDPGLQLLCLVPHCHWPSNPFSASCLHIYAVWDCKVRSVGCGCPGKWAEAGHSCAQGRF